MERKGNDTYRLSRSLCFRKEKSSVSAYCMEVPRGKNSGRDFRLRQCDFMRTFFLCGTVSTCRAGCGMFSGTGPGCLSGKGADFWIIFCRMFPEKPYSNVCGPADSRFRLSLRLNAEVRLYAVSAVSAYCPAMFPHMRLTCVFWERKKRSRVCGSPAAPFL